MPADFVAYIDEAGDEGFGKLSSGIVGGQSHWLILGACIVTKENDKTLPRLRDEILKKFPLRKKHDLHFREMKHEQKTVICQHIAKMPVGLCVSMSHKVTIPGSSYEDQFKQKGYLYNWLLRWLLERVTKACYIKAGGKPCSLDVILSKRGSTNYESMMEYFCLMRDGKEAIPPVSSIRWDILKVPSIRIENHSRWAGLQIADCATSAFFAGVEPNVYGNYEPQYAQHLKSRLLRLEGASLNFGLTPVPSLQKSRLTSQQTAFFRWFDQ